MKTSPKPCVFALIFLTMLSCLSFQVWGQTVVRDINSNFLTTVPPAENISYQIVETNQFNYNGCSVDWKLTNASNRPNGVTIPQVGTGLNITWLNTDGNAVAEAELKNCDVTSLNGKKATYTVPIRYLGPIGSVAINSSPSPGYVNCGSQSVNFTVGAAQNATNYTWDYSSLQNNGWSYVSGQGTQTLVLNSSNSTGGSINVTATRSGASNVSSSTSGQINRPYIPNNIDIAASYGNYTDDRICGGTRGYFVPDYGGGITYSWSSSGPVSLSPAGGPNYIDVTTNAQGAVTLSIVVSNGCSSVTKTKNIWAGTPPEPSITIVGVAPYGAVDANANLSSSINWGITSYKWYRDGSLVKTGTSPFEQYIPGGNCGQQHYLQVAVENNCGTSTLTSPGYPNYYSFPCSYYRIGPNPAKDNISVAFDDAEKAEYLPDQIELYSEKSTSPVASIDVQNAYKSKSMENGNTIKFNVKSLPRGTYYLKIKNSRNQEKPVDSVRILLEN